MVGLAKSFPRPQNFDRSFLDRVDGKWSNIKLPMGAGEVATLRIIMLWINHLRNDSKSRTNTPRR